MAQDGNRRKGQGDQAMEPHGTGKAESAYAMEGREDKGNVESHNGTTSRKVPSTGGQLTQETGPEWNTIPGNNHNQNKKTKKAKSISAFQHRGPQHVGGEPAKMYRNLKQSRQ